MKLCMGCMNQMEDHMSVCPYCGFNEAELRQESYYLAPGTVVGGKYIVGKAMSYGGYTVTYLGMDAEKNRKVMIKEYLPSDFSTRSEGDSEVTIYSGDAQEQFEQGLTTFLNEANRIQQLHNPRGIMQVYDCVAENDTGYVISEYLEGKTLKQIMAEGKRFSPQEAKDFICQILEGLRQVHPLDIIHCDIAPETIFVTNMGEIKLLDFGATRYVTTANSKSLAIILKQGYAPEEQYRSQGVRGPWTDVYALGAVMYHMITGVVPLESVDRALVDELKEPSKLGIQIPPNMENALMNALNVYQAERTPSAEVFYQELNSPQVQRIQVKKKKYETGKFPTWAKVLVAGLLCVVVAGGVIIVMSSGEHKNVGADSKVAKAESVLGMSETDANEKLKQNEITFEANEVIFDKSVKDGSEILTQEPAAGEAVSDGMIKGTVLSSEKCMYDELLDQKDNVYSLAENFGIDKSQLQPSEEKDASDKSKKFQNLYGVILNDGTKLNLKDLEKREKDNAILELSDVQTVTYYTSPYLYKKKLGNYVGQNISQVSFTSYTAGKNGARKKAGTGTPTCDSRYYSFDKEKGDIVKQNVKPGKTYDASKMEGALFVTVKERLYRQESETADALIKRLKDRGFNVKENGSGSEVDSVTVSGEGGAKYFTKSDKVTVTRKEKVVSSESRSSNNSSNTTKKTQPNNPLN
ncbi:MAG: protein kinase [Roseburia sp.]|nr:protein kinase [Roseburia sp.]